MTPAPSATAPVSPVLDVVDARVTRGGRRVLHDVSLRVGAGEHWALIGPNGAGKTTLLTLCGALGHPTAGTVDVLGRRLGRVELSELRRHIGHVDPRHRMAGDNSVREVVLTGFTGSSDPVPRWHPPTSRRRGSSTSSPTSASRPACRHGGACCPRANVAGP